MRAPLAQLRRGLGAPPGVSSITEGSDFSLWHDEDVRFRHTVLQWQPRRLLILTWDFPKKRPSRVSFTLTETTTPTATLTVHHEDLDDAMPYAAGWHRHLQYLGAHLKGDNPPIEDFCTGYDHLVELDEEDEPKSDPSTRCGRHRGVRSCPDSLGSSVSSACPRGSGCATADSPRGGSPSVIIVR